jgi:glycosyltransferase involved in cell wall biosynthesis
VSTTEGIPVSIMEAMSFGIPVIATDVGGTQEIVNKDNGILLHSQLDETDLASAIRIAMKEDLWQRKTNALETWRSKYNAPTNYQNFVSELSQSRLDRISW